MHGSQKLKMVHSNLFVKCVLRIFILGRSHLKPMRTSETIHNAYLLSAQQEPMCFRLVVYGNKDVVKN